MKALPRRGVGVDGNLGHPLMRDPYIDLTIEQIRAAQITVALHAYTVEDCAELLDMLGIGAVG